MKFAKFALAGGLVAIPLAAYAAGKGFGFNEASGPHTGNGTIEVRGGGWGGGHGDGHGGHGGRGGHGGNWLFGLIEMAQELDTDGDGAVSRAEFLAPHDARVQAMDADGDGQVTEQEMIDFAMARVQARIAERFADLDSDGDGVLTAEEIAARPNERFARMDQDDDERLTVHDLPDFSERGHGGGGRGHGSGHWGHGPFGPSQDWDGPAQADTPADEASAE